jgi:hypothetical protein
LGWDRKALVERMKMLHDAEIGPLANAASRAARVGPEKENPHVS